MRRPRITLTTLGIALAATVSATTLAGCGGSDAASAESDANQVDLVGFAVIKSAYDALGEAFAATPEGTGVSVRGSYGASGAQSRAVIAGQPADVVALSLSPDVTNIEEAGLVDPSWDDDADHGIVSTSVVTLVVREGNPKGISGWADLVKPGVGIVTPDPGTSGSAKWNLLGAYTYGLGDDHDRAAAETYLKAFIGNVVSWNDSGRTATEAFVNGTGDVLISYENEAIAARAAGTPVDYVVPATTFKIENPAAVTTTAPQAAQDFLAFVRGPEGQAILGGKGFRPVGDAPSTATDVDGANDPTDPFPAIGTLWTVDDLGGWSVVNDELFDKESGLVTELRR